MMLAFTLSMPGVASWDGKWTGEGNCYAIVRSVNAEEALRACNLRLGGSLEPGRETGCHRYSFGDGWHASIDVRGVDRNEARRLRRKSDGFCGYDWMVDAILKTGRIVVEHTR